MIRPAEPRDAPALTRIINRAYAVEKEFIDGDRVDDAEVRGHLAAGKFLVLDEGGELTGCVLLAVDPPRGYLGLLSVDPDRQAGGRGRQLIAAVEERCRAAGCAYLDIKVVDRRRELPPFYRRLGFVEIGREPFVDERLRLPSEFILMRKNLPP